MDNTHPCPRCGTLVRWSGIGRPPRWCSDDCRRRGAEQGIQVQEIVRERVVELHVPHNPVSAAGVVLGDVDAVAALLRQLTERVRAVPRTELERVRLRRLLMLSPDIAALAAAVREVTAQQVPALADRQEELQQVPAVLGEPASGATAAQRSPASARGKGQRKKRRRHR